MTKDKFKHIMLSIEHSDFNILEELSKRKRLPIAALCRMLIIQNKEFVDTQEKK